MTLATYIHVVGGKNTIRTHVLYRYYAGDKIIKRFSFLLFSTAIDDIFGISKIAKDNFNYLILNLIFNIIIKIINFITEQNWN